MTAVAVEPGIALSGPMSAALEFLCWGGGRSPLEPLASYVAARNVCPLGDAGDALSALIDLGYVRMTRAGARDPLFHLTDSGRDLACADTDEQEAPMTDTPQDLATVSPDPKPEKAPAKKRTGSRKTAAARTVAAKDTAAEQAPPVEDVTGHPNEEITDPAKRITGRVACLAALRAAGRPLTTNEIASAVVDTGVVPGLGVTGKTPKATLSAQVSVAAKAGKWFVRFGDQRPAAFVPADDAPDSPEDVVKTMKAYFKKQPAA